MGSRPGSETKLVINGVEFDPADAGKHGVDIELLHGKGAGPERVKRLMREMLEEMNVEGIDLDNLKTGESSTRVVVNGEVIDPADAAEHGIDWEMLQGIDRFDDAKEFLKRIARQMGLGDIDLDNLGTGQTITRVIVNGEEVDPADAGKHGVKIEVHADGWAEAGGEGVGEIVEIEIDKAGPREPADDEKQDRQKQEDVPKQDPANTI